MEGPLLSFVFYDASGEVIAKSKLPYAKSGTFGELKEKLFANSKGLQSIPKDSVCFFKDKKILKEILVVVECFPEAKDGKEIHLTLARKDWNGIPNRSNSQVHPNPGAPILKELAMKAAKNVKGLARIQEDRLVNVLLQSCNERTLIELAEIKKPSASGGGGSKKKKGEGKVDAQKLEWTKFYTAIKDSVNNALQMFEQTNGHVEIGLVVDPNFSLDSFSRECNGNADTRLVVLKNWLCIVALTMEKIYIILG